MPTLQTPVTVVRPVDAQYDPAVHDEQLDAPVKGWKYPEEQLVQEVAAIAEYFPDAQDAVIIVRPVVAQ